MGMHPVNNGILRDARPYKVMGLSFTRIFENFTPVGTFKMQPQKITLDTLVTYPLLTQGNF